MVGSHLLLAGHQKNDENNFWKSTSRSLEQTSHKRNESYKHCWVDVCKGRAKLFFTRDTNLTLVLNVIKLIFDTKICYKSFNVIVDDCRRKMSLDDVHVT